jgi:hypothetical protein
MELLIMQFSPASYYFIPLRSKYSPQRPVQNTLSLFASLNIGNQLHNHSELKAKPLITILRKALHLCSVCPGPVNQVNARLIYFLPVRSILAGHGSGAV